MSGGVEGLNKEQEVSFAPGEPMMRSLYKLDSTTLRPTKAQAISLEKKENQQEKKEQRQERKENKQEGKQEGKKEGKKEGKQKYRELNTAINAVYKGTKTIEIKSIKEINGLNTEEKRELIKAIKGKRNEILQELSFEDKKLVVENISNNAGLSPDDKLQLADLVLSLTEKQQWIRDLIKDKNLSKENRKSKIEGFFRVYELVNSMPPYQRNNKPTRDLFAKKAGIESYTETREQNEKIREWILNIMLEIGDLYTSGADVLDEKHDNRLKEMIVTSDKQLAIGDALSTLSIEQRQKINMLTKEQFQDFINELNNIGSQNAQKLEEKFGVEKDAQNIFGLNLEMSIMQKKLDNIKIQFEAAGGNPAITDQDRKVHCEKFQMSYPKTEKEKLAIDVSILEKRINNSDIDPIKKEELVKQVNTVKTDIYTIYSKYEQTKELKQIRGTDYYNEVETNYNIENGLSTLDRKVDINIHAKTIDAKARGKFGDQIQSNLIPDSIERIKEFPPVKEDSLLSFFEKEDAKKDAQVGENEQNSDQKNPEQDKQNIEKVKKDLKEETNHQLKNKFVNRAILFIQDALDINIDQQNKDNVLSQFKFDENQKIVDQKILLEGNYNGQKITLQYDMQTGNMLYQPYLSKQDETQDSISINNDKKSANFKPFEPKVTGPSINEISTASEKINYQEVVDSAKGSKKTYADNYSKELDKVYPIKFADEFKDGIKKQYIKTILAQDMIDLLGKDIHSPKSVEKDADKKLYPFYKMIYENTYERNGETNIQDLQMLRGGIQKMKDLYNNIGSIEDSEAKQILDKLFSQSKKTQTESVKNQKETKNDNQTESLDKKIDFRNGFLSAMDSNPNDASLIIDPKSIETYVACIENKEKNKDNPLIEKIKNNIPSGFLADNFLENNKDAWRSPQA